MLQRALWAPGRATRLRTRPGTVLGRLMADATQFDHDRLSHLLADRLLRVPQFQRSYSWDETNVDEFLTDLKTARKKDAPYFMGTVVFANSQEDGQRQQIVDGQQRLATTAILLVAVRDLLADYKKAAQSKHIDELYLRGYDLESEDMVERLILILMISRTTMLCLRGLLLALATNRPLLRATPPA